MAACEALKRLAHGVLFGCVGREQGERGESGTAAFVFNLQTSKKATHVHNTFEDQERKLSHFTCLLLHRLSTQNVPQKIQKTLLQTK